MNWNEIKASLAAFFESFALPFVQQNQPELRPIPVEVRRPEQQRHY